MMGIAMLKPGDRVHILDRSGLATELKAAIQRRFRGNLSEAARSAGLRQPDLHKLATAKRVYVSVRTARAVRELVGPRRAQRVDDALLPGPAQMVLKAYGDWCIKYATNEVRVIDWANHRTGFVPVVSVHYGYTRYMRVVWLATELLRRYPSYFKPLVEAVGRKGHGVARLIVALHRVVGPLIDARESGYVELRWEELEERGTLAQFIDAGVRREVILLDRAPDLERAQEVATREIAEIYSPPRYQEAHLAPDELLESYLPWLLKEGEGLGQSPPRRRRRVRQAGPISRRPPTRRNEKTRGRK
jgi:hypothetical protein